MSVDKSYEINIDPRILELLGPSLYTNIYYILAELIANAYDANATNVYIIQENDRIIVEDDGSGMSYDDGDVKKYLNVAHETRVNLNESFVSGSNKKRKKMGRKGVGKLAALSVSENVEIHTVKDGEKSGFVLSRHVADDHMLTPIPENEIVFQKITGNGTSIVMSEPQYSLHKGLDAIANNLLKIFPMIDSEFKIHIFRNGKSRSIESFEKEIIKNLGGLIIIGDRFTHLRNHFNCQLKKREEIEENLLTILEQFIQPLMLKNKAGEEKEYDLKIEGWIGVYRTTRGRKADTTDFPDNFISLLSNKKLGEFNILPTVGKNALAEVYIVGQLHIDLFEETDLPDIALSNRQGYKTDDLRYQTTIQHIRNSLLPKVISLRGKFARYQKDQKDEDKLQKDKAREKTLKVQIDAFKNKASSSAAKKIAASVNKGTNIDSRLIEDTVRQAINVNFPEMGIKRSVDNAKKKILLSHTGADKAVCDFVYNLLTYNNVPAAHIIYTNSDNADSRIPQQIPKIPIFDYLREFFVESYSTEKIYVLYVTSEDMANSWPAVAEVGAGWITKSTHDIFSINNFRPQRPLDVDCEWANVSNDNDEVSLVVREADKVADKIIMLCDYLGYSSKTKAHILEEIERIANVIKDN